MDGADASAQDGEDGIRSDTALARIRLWTRISSSYSHEPVAVDEAPAIGRIVDLSSTAARSVCPFRYIALYRSSGSRTRSPPTSLSSTNGASAQETNHANLTNGHFTRASFRFSDRFDRTRALSAKYGFNLTESEWAVPPNQPVQRVERSIRMRIRFRCHQCNTQYGGSRVCSQCSHQRCNRCVRHPPRRTTPRVRLADAARINNFSVENIHTHSIAETASALQYIPVPVMPQAHINGGVESVSRRDALTASQHEPLQNGAGPEHLEPNHSRIARRQRVRVHHTCHECHRTFSRGEYTCSGCGHERCKDCPRDPPRTHPAPGMSNRTLEPSTLSLASESDDGGDEYEDEAIPEAPISTTQEASAADTVTSPRGPSTLGESTIARDVDGAPPESPPPV
jgi:hypothetical protein